MSPSTYSIQVEARLDASHWERWFEGMETETEDPGSTLIMGRVPDQAALHGILAQIRDLGLVLVSVQRLIEDEEGQPIPARRGSQAKPDEAQCSILDEEGVRI